MTFGPAISGPAFSPRTFGHVFSGPTFSPIWSRIFRSCIFCARSTPMGHGCNIMTSITSTAQWRNRRTKMTSAVLDVSLNNGP